MEIREATKCDVCGKTKEYDDLADLWFPVMTTVALGVAYCNDCWRKKWIQCSVCGAWHTSAELQEVEGFLICGFCAAAQTCEICGEVGITRGIDWKGVRYCADCFAITI